MKNIIILLLLTILCLMYPPNGQASDTIKIGPSGACIVDNTLNHQRFYYCGKQETGCANETHNKNDLYGHLDGNESTQEFFFTHNQKIITVSGQTYWCCNGTTNTMGKIQPNACASIDLPPNDIIIEDTTPDKSLALDILNLAINTITKDVNTVTASRPPQTVQTCHSATHPIYAMAYTPQKNTASNAQSENILIKKTPKTDIAAQHLH